MENLKPDTDDKDLDRAHIEEQNLQSLHLHEIGNSHGQRESAGTGVNRWSGKNLNTWHHS